MKQWPRSTSPKELKTRFTTTPVLTLSEGSYGYVIYYVASRVRLGCVDATRWHRWAPPMDHRVNPRPVLVVRSSPPATLPLKDPKFWQSVDPQPNLRTVGQATNPEPGPWIEATYSNHKR
ncbi:hypothetical protein MTR67_034824 [Solanum verrucosum]|uniref:Uncharacterized protein n=1 Tax=Solanum verrucosum TaxID=315347 RepID=A0AAF0U921_SOLVR|nr:hypothetical protein MTR67_034824 [Solanum verrucosum]